jgi:hypothetical protein
LQKVLLENGFQNTFDGNLQQLVLSSWNTQSKLPVLPNPLRDS